MYSNSFLDANVWLLKRRLEALAVSGSAWVFMSVV